MSLDTLFLSVLYLQFTAITILFLFINLKKYIFITVIGMEMDPLLLQLPEWRRSKRYHLCHANLLLHLGDLVTCYGIILAYRRQKLQVYVGDGIVNISLSKIAGNEVPAMQVDQLWEFQGLLNNRSILHAYGIFPVPQVGL